jgi:thioredoxin-dependent peroxiredoxin
MTLAIGDKLPDFKAATSEGAIRAKDLKGSIAILYFYPKDDTPGCTTEACDFRDNLPKFKRLNAKVYGVSKDSLQSHDRFARKYELPFTLISDESGEMCESFGTWVEKSMYGKKYMGIERATFLVDDKGVIRQIWRSVKVKNHVDEVLSEIKNL